MAIRFPYLKQAGTPSQTYFRRMILVKDLENSFMTRNNRCKFRLNVASKANDIKSLYIRTFKKYPSACILVLSNLLFFLIFVYDNIAVAS